MNSIAKNWAFTVNNYDEDAVDILQNLVHLGKVRYLVYGREISDSGTPHLQGYLQMDKKCRFSKIKELLPRGSHIDSEYQNSTAQANKIYCTKDGIWEEFGEMATKGGSNPSYYAIIIDYPNIFSPIV